MRAAVLDKVTDFVLFLGKNISLFNLLAYFFPVDHFCLFCVRRKNKLLQLQTTTHGWKIYRYFLGKLFVAVGMGALSWAFFTNKINTFSFLTAPTLNYYWLLVIVSTCKYR